MSICRSVRPFVCLSCWHTHCNSPGGSMRCGQRTFQPDNKKDQHTCWILEMFEYSIIHPWLRPWQQISLIEIVWEIRSRSVKAVSERDRYDTVTVFVLGLRRRDIWLCYNSLRHRCNDRQRWQCHHSDPISRLHQHAHLGLMSLSFTFMHRIHGELPSRWRYSRTVHCATLQHLI